MRLRASQFAIVLVFAVMLSLAVPTLRARLGDTKTEGPKLSEPRKAILPEKPYNYAAPDLPPHFNSPSAKRFDNTPADNPITDHGATLGRVLFYDKRLSADNSVSCGSCHVQANSFADPQRFSNGFKGERTDRHAMNLVELRFARNGRYFWDERASPLEAMVLMPIQSKLEMGRDLPRLVEDLGKDSQYQKLFRNAFGDDMCTSERIGMALAQFLRAMVSCGSRFDEGLAKVNSLRNDFPNYSDRENQGKRVFLRDCASCHLPEGQQAHFTLISPANTGLDPDIKGGDAGVGDITLRTRDMGLFRSPSLRNVEVSGPYMHDGRFDTLEKVVEHYSNEFKAHPNLHPRVHKLDLSSADKVALVAFLKTLTDHKFLSDPKFSDPFR